MLRFMGVFFMGVTFICASLQWIKHEWHRLSPGSFSFRPDGIQRKALDSDIRWNDGEGCERNRRPVHTAPQPPVYV